MYSFTPSQLLLPAPLLCTQLISATCAAGEGDSLRDIILVFGLLCRYFTVPFLLLALHMRPPRPGQLAVMGAAYAAVNAATIFAFLFWPYSWPDGSTARFMW